MSLKKIVCTLSIIGVIFSSNMITTFASEVDTSNLKDSIVISEDNDYIIIPNDTITDKESYLSNLSDSLSYQPKSRAGTYSLSATDKAYYNNSYMYSKFSSTLQDNFSGSKVNGSSRVAWVGTSPHNCTTIALIDTIKLTGVSPNISVGDGWSISGGLTSETAVWEKELSNQWAIDHSYSNLTFDGVDLYYRQTATGEFQFGTKFFTTTATDYVWP